MTQMGNRRPGRELLCHPPPAQSTGVSTLWPAGGSLDPVATSGPPLVVWDGWYYAGWRDPRLPCCLSFSRRKVRMRHQTQATKDRVRRLPRHVLHPKSQRPSWVQEREGLGRRRARIFWEQGGFVGTSCAVTQAPIQRGARALASCSFATVLKFVMIFTRLCVWAYLRAWTLVHTGPSCLGRGVGGRRSANTPSSLSSCHDSEQAFPGLQCGGGGAEDLGFQKRERIAPTSTGCR